MGKIDEDYSETTIPNYDKYMTLPVPGEPTPDNLKRYAVAIERFKTFEERKLAEFRKSKASTYLTTGRICEIESFIKQALQEQREEITNKCLCCNNHTATICPSCSDHYGEYRNNDCPNS